MAIPHNTVQDAERLRIEEQINSYLLNGGEIESLPDYDQPKEVQLDGEIKRVYSFIKLYFESQKNMPPRRRITAETGIGAKKLKEYLWALDKMGKVKCNKHGAVIGVN